MRAVNIQSCIHLYAHAINLKLRDNFRETHTEHSLFTKVVTTLKSICTEISNDTFATRMELLNGGDRVSMVTLCTIILMNLMHTPNSLNQHSGMVKCWHGHTDFPIILYNFFFIEKKTKQNKSKKINSNKQKQTKPKQPLTAAD